MLKPKDANSKIHNPLLLGNFQWYLVTYEFLIIFDLKNGEIRQQYYTEDIIEAQDAGQNKLRLVILDRKHNKKEGHINMETDGSNHRLVREINKLVKFYRPKFVYENWIAERIDNFKWILYFKCKC